MLFRVTRTFAETTPESATEGDLSDHGFISEGEELTFRELVDLLRDHPDASCSPRKYWDGSTWFSSPWAVESYQDGTERQESVHLDRDQRKDARAVRYWIKAATLAECR